MKSHNAYTGIDPSIISQIRYHACRLKHRKCFSNTDIEDIEQDLILGILPAFAKYNKDKSSIGTYFSNIISNISNSLILKHTYIKYGGKTDQVCLDSEYQIEAPDSFEDLALSIDVNKQKLPEHLQIFCEQLKTFTVTEMAQMTGRSRQAIYRNLKSLRSIFLPCLCYIKK